MKNENYVKIKHMSIESSLEKNQMPEPEKEKSETLTRFEKHKEEMEKIERETKPEIEEKLRDALEVLHSRIQSVQESKKDFPSRTELGDLIEEIPVFARLAEGAKKMFVHALENKKEFRSPDPQIFIKKGMEVLELFIHTATLKKGGEAWLQQKAEQRAEKIQPEETEESPEEI